MPRALFLASCLVVACTALRSDPPSHTEAFSKDGLIKANVADLKDTLLVAHPDVPLDPAKNVIWCGTLQLAWNEAITLVGEKLQFVTQPPLVDLLNREDFTRKDLAPGSYVAIADFERKHVVAKIRAALERVFHGAASPELIPPVLWPATGAAGSDSPLFALGVIRPGISAIRKKRIAQPIVT